MMLILKLIIKELRAHPRFSLLFILNASFGLCGFIAVEMFKHSIESELNQHSKAILGADLSLSSRRPIHPQERQMVLDAVDVPIRESQITQLYSMISSDKNLSKLAHVKFIEENFPFYGQLDLQHQGLKNHSGETNLHNHQNAWVYPELLSQLNIKIGDWISVGASKFQVTDVLQTDPSKQLSSNLAPRIYLSRKHLEKTGLLQEGSLAWHSMVFALPQHSIFFLNNLSQNIFKKIDDPQVQVRTHQKSSEMTSRLLSYVNDFLSLTTLCALLLAAASLSFLIRSYFREKVYPIAIFLSLGLSRIKTFLIYLLEITFLSGVSFAIATLLALGIQPLLKILLGSLIPFDISFQLGDFLGSVSKGMLLWLILIGISLPSILQIKTLQLASLLHPKTEWKTQLQTTIILTIIGIIGFWGLAILQSQSFVMGSLFIAIVIGGGLICLSLGWLTLKWMDQKAILNKISPTTLRWIIRELVRHRGVTLFCFLSLNLIVFLLSLQPQIQKSIVDHIKTPDQQPSLFLFDIQEDQIEPLKKMLQTNNITLDKTTPLIRARLKTVNQKPFNKGTSQTPLTREKQREMRFRNRGFNLTYRTQIYESETILKGEDFLKTPSIKNNLSLPGISLETRFAQRLGLQLNDKLSFEVEGQEMTGVVKNIRRVNWLSFDPNFFVVFEAHNMKAFFKTFLATLPQLPIKQKNQVQYLISSQFPNISIVDISQISQQLVSLSKQITRALFFITLGVFLMGLLVFYSICSFYMLTRQSDISLLKTLGVPFSTIKISILSQFSLIALIAALIGVLISPLCFYIISALFFDSLWSFSIWIPVILVLGTPFLVLILTNQSLNLEKSSK